MSLQSDEEAATFAVLRRTRNHITLIFLGVAALVIASAGILYTASNHVITSNARESGMLHLVDGWQLLVATVRESEVRQREFVISGDEQDLNAFNGTAARVSPILKGIEAHEGNKDLLIRLRDLTARRMAVLHAGIKLRQTEGLEAADALIRKGEGKALMAELDDLANGVQESRKGDVATEMKRQDDWSLGLASVFILLGSANILVLYWSYKRINKAIEAEEAALEMRYMPERVAPQ
jgi:CHASE3 domain sensor protein